MPHIYASKIAPRHVLYDISICAYMLWSKGYLQISIVGLFL